MRYSWCIIASASIVLAGCLVVPPVNYPIPPGISASFPPSQLIARDGYSKTFCSVLAEQAFAAEKWGLCNTYVDMPAPLQPEPLPALSTKWTLLLVGGFGAQCFAPDVVAFKDAADHLLSEHAIGYHPIDVTAFGSSEDNAAIIAEKVASYKEEHFIAITHSKGAADFMVALSKYPDALERVEALITVAGAVGGSWLADDLLELNEQVLKKFDLPTCLPPRTLANGLDSMQRRNRQEFLAKTDPAWKGYSISAVSEKGNTSKVLKPLWTRVRAYAREQDSHIIEREAVVPGGAFLGRALGDHWAVAMPFYGNPKVSGDALKIIDQNRFPRPALIEAAVRVVTTALK